MIRIGEGYGKNMVKVESIPFGSLVRYDKRVCILANSDHAGCGSRAHSDRLHIIDILNGVEHDVSIGARLDVLPDATLIFNHKGEATCED